MEYKGVLDYEVITNRLIAGATTGTDRTLKNQVDKWLEMLEMIHFTSEQDHNIYQQILFVKIISMFCVKNSRSAFQKESNGEGGILKGNKKYQILIGKFVFSSEKSTPLKFGYEHRSTEIPYVTFRKRGGKDNAFFLDKNPILEELFRSDFGNDNQDNSFTLEEISNNDNVLMPYIDYICAIVELYAHLCLNNFQLNLDAVSKSGCSFTHVMSVLRNDKIHIKLRNSYTLLARIIFLDIDPFISIIHNYNR